MTDIIDEIDELVEDRLAGYNDRSGYDHNVNQDRCWNCDGEWHGLAITERMRRMRWLGAVDPDYRYAGDDSRLYCPGSDVAGPVHNEPGLPRWTIHVGDSDAIDAFQAINMRVVAAVQRMADDLAETFRRLGEAVRTVQEQTKTLVPENERPHPLHPAIRRPSHTPPMWANNPARTRRNKYGPTRRVK